MQRPCLMCPGVVLGICCPRQGGEKEPQTPLPLTAYRPSHNRVTKSSHCPRQPPALPVNASLAQPNSSRSVGPYHTYTHAQDRAPKTSQMHYKAKRCIYPQTTCLYALLTRLQRLNSVHFCPVSSGIAHSREVVKKERRMLE